jgi:hypothetical protein
MKPSRPRQAVGLGRDGSADVLLLLCGRAALIEVEVVVRRDVEVQVGVLGVGVPLIEVEVEVLPFVDVDLVRVAAVGVVGMGRVGLVVVLSVVVRVVGMVAVAARVCMVPVVAARPLGRVAVATAAACCLSRPPETGRTLRSIPESTDGCDQNEGSSAILDRSSRTRTSVPCEASISAARALTAGGGRRDVTAAPWQRRVHGPTRWRS